MQDLVKVLRANGRKRPTMHYTEAKEAWRAIREREGWTGSPPLLTPPENNVKLNKTKQPVYGLSLAPADASGIMVCRYSTPECRAGCVAYAGNGLYPKVGRARQLKVHFALENPDAFLVLLAREFEKVAEANGRVRPNTFSDIPYEQVAPWLFDLCEAYDYTKWWSRESTPGYDLTFSVSEKTPASKIERKLEQNGRVAVVFDTIRGHDLPRTYLGYDVVDGDKSDARWLDPEGVVVGLRAKGRMRSNIETWRMVKHG